MPDTANTLQQVVDTAMIFAREWRLSANIIGVPVVYVVNTNRASKVRVDNGTQGSTIEYTYLGVELPKGCPWGVHVGKLSEI